MPVRPFSPAFAAILALAAPLHAQTRDTTRLEDLVVTATRTPMAPRALGSATDQLKPAELSRRQITSLREALQLVPGGTTFVTGGPGGVTSLFLRGAASTQTLLLVDGMRINDANANYGSFLGGADLAGLGRLEVVRGPQSTLYGGAAIGGVVALDAARGTGPARGSATVEGGSFGSWTTRAEAQGSAGGLGFAAAASANGTDNQRRPNGWDQRTQLVRVDGALSPWLRIGGTFRGLQQTYTSPGDLRTTNTTPVDRTVFENNLGTLFLDAMPTASWRSRMVVGVQESYTRNGSRYNGDPEFIFTLSNQRYALDWQNTVEPFRGSRVVAGLNREWNSVTSSGDNRDERLLGLYAEAEAAPAPGLNLTAGIRNDDYTTFDEALTWRVTAAWAPGDGSTKFRGSYGTGFMPPSLSARFGSAFEKPNPAIRPERSRGWDAGIDQEFLRGRGGVSVTWFRNSLRDLIAYQSAPFPELGQEVNIDQARTWGLEFSGRIRVGGLEARAAYTRLRAETPDPAEPSEKRLIRRPGHTLSSDVLIAPDERTTAGAGFALVADRRDTDFNQFPSVRVDPGDYAVARVYGSRTIGRRLSLSARVENLFDTHYEPVFGFPALGRSVLVSASIRF